jgi:hypothetical protein
MELLFTAPDAYILILTGAGLLIALARLIHRRHGMGLADVA